MNLKHLQELKPDGTLYINDRMGTVEAELPVGSYLTSHGPALLELGNGDILCAWFAGTFEGSCDVNIICSRLPKGQDRWEAPVTVSNDPLRSDQNPSLFSGPDGAVWVMYTSQLGRMPGKDNMQFTSQIRRQKSYDRGRSWGAFDTMFHAAGTFARQPVQILSNGRWLYGNWLCSESPDGLAHDPSAVQISDNRGRTWRQVMIPESSGRVHPNVVELERNHLVIFMRSREADFIYRSDSFDNGESWEIPRPTSLPNNNSSISAIKLRSGRLAIAYNHASAPEEAKNGAAWPGLRCPVTVAISEDGGKTWPFIRHMEQGEGFAGKENRVNNRQYEYPFLMQARDGRLHLAFSYKNRESVKWMTFSEEDILGERRGAGTYNPTSGEIC